MIVAFLRFSFVAFLLYPEVRRTTIFAEKSGICIMKAGQSQCEKVQLCEIGLKTD